VLDGAARGRSAAYFKGLSRAVGVMVLTALILWRILDAGYHGGFERWVVAMLVTAGVLVILGLRAAWRGGRPLALGLVCGAILGSGLLMLGLFVWVLTQMGG
jgi:hypothetical protein